MGQVYIGLHDLEMWERRLEGGNVQHRIREIYLESCRNASTQWRREFTRQQNASNTVLMRLCCFQLERIYGEAKARVMALSTYDEHDCLTLTGTPTTMDDDS